MTLEFLPATELLQRIRSRQVGSRELLELYIRRIEAHDGAINAVVVRQFAAARARADEADAALAKGVSLGPLHGLPMTVKESFQLRGTPTTFGLVPFRNNIAARNATAVDRLIAAGAIIMGKTNVPPGLMDGQSDNEIYGRTRNPWDLERTPGGSSGGSAAALSAGLTALELGSDIASSIRNPAHFCGVFGHKPTFGICPTAGHSLTDLNPFTDIAVAGPMARSAADLELALAVLAGPDGTAARAASLHLPQSGPRELQDFRVAVVLDDSFAEVDREVRDPLAAVAKFLEGEGARVSVGTRPPFDSEELYHLYMILLRSATSLAMSDDEYQREVAAARGYDRTTRSVGKTNSYGATLSHRDWLRFDLERSRYRAQWSRFFEQFDLLLCPPLSTAAFPHSGIPPQQRKLLVNGHEVPFENQLFWAGYGGLAYLPATVAPLGLTPGGLPVGVQILGPEYADLTCLRFARLLELRYRSFVPPPALAGS